MGIFLCTMVYVYTSLSQSSFFSYSLTKINDIIIYKVEFLLVFKDEGSQCRKVCDLRHKHRPTQLDRLKV